MESWEILGLGALVLLAWWWYDSMRARFVLAAIEDIKGGVQLIWNVSVEREGGDKPVLVAEWLTRRYF